MFLDSRLVVGQVQGELEARDERMQGYLSQVRHLQSRFESFNLLHIPRSGNTHVDSLAMLTTSLAQSLPRVILIEDLCKPTEVKGKLVHVHQVKVGPSWMDPIVLFLRDEILPEDKSEADKVQRKVPRFQLSKNQKLYKRSFFGPYLLCIHPKASKLLFKELHEGICESHIGGRSLSHRAITQGYWQPNIQKETQEYVKKYDQCQRFAPNIHQPEGVLNPLSSPWPFTQWGLDIVDPFPKVVGNKRYLLVSTDYFTNGLKPSPWRILEMWTPRSFSGKTLSPDSRSFAPSSRIMAFNLIANLSGDTAMIWELRINILPQLIPKRMDKPTLLTRSQLMDSRRGWTIRRESGQKSCHMSSGRIGPRLASQLGKPPFQ